VRLTVGDLSSGGRRDLRFEFSEALAFHTRMRPSRSAMMMASGACSTI
jgi:hypothetical protein